MDYFIYMILSPIAFAVVFITFTVTWKFRHERIGQALLVYFILVIFFLVSNVFELLADSESWMLIWTKLQISFNTFIPVAWVVFALSLTRSESPFLKKLILLLLIIPFLSILMVATYPQNHFFYSAHSVVNIDIYSTLDTHYAPFFWVFGAHEYTLLIAGAIIIMKNIRSENSLFRKPSLFIALGTAAPLIANLLHILPFSFLPRKDFTPLAFALSGLFFFISIYWERFLEIIPFSRNLIVDEMDQGLLIVDPDGVVIDANRALLSLFSLKSSDIISKSLSSVSCLWEIIMEPYLLRKPVFEVIVPRGVNRITCSVTIKPVMLRKGTEYGCLIMFTDISLLVGLYDEKLSMLRKIEDSNKKLEETRLQLLEKENQVALGFLASGIIAELRDQVVREQELSGEARARTLEVFSNFLYIADHDKEDSEGYDINAAVKKILDLLNLWLKPSFSINTSLGGLPSIDFRGSKMNQILLALLVYAIKAAERLEISEKKVLVKTWRDDSSVFCSIFHTGQFLDFSRPGETWQQNDFSDLISTLEIIKKHYKGTFNLGYQDKMAFFILSLPIRSVY